MTENVSVSVRIRPLSTAEIKSGDVEIWDVIPVEGKATVVLNPINLPETHLYAKRPPQFLFDRVFQHFASNKEVFEQSAQGLVRSVMMGYNGTIFAYGQTSSGKTYTMVGTDLTGTKGSQGVISMAIDEIFECIEKTSDREFLLRLSYMEIYNEVVNDLLAPQSTNLRILEDSVRGIRVDGLKEEIVMSKKQALSLIAAGGVNRHIGATNFNEQSSRSHTIFRMIIESRKRSLDESTSKSHGSVRVSYLDLIDLAGSERAWKEEGLRRKEGGFINKSLLTLATVISKLSSGEGGHIPYRDSKLTRILQPSLERNAKVSIICNITPSLSQMEETHNTLKFGFRAKNVKVKSFVNEVLDEKALLKQYRLEILQLKRRMTTIAPLGGSIASEEEIIQVMEQKKMMEEKLKEHEQTKHALEERIKKLTQLILVSSNPFPGEADGVARESYVERDTDFVAAQPDFVLHNQTGNVSVNGAQSPQSYQSSPPNFDDTRVIQLEKQVQEQQSTIASLQQDVEHKGAHIRDLNSTIASLQNKLRINEHLQQQVSNLRDEIQQRDDRIQELMDAFSSQSSQPKSSDHTRTDAAPDPNIAEIKMKLAIQSSENQKLTSELHSKDTELTRWMRQYNTLERRLQTLEEENRALRSRSRPPGINTPSALPMSTSSSYTPNTPSSSYRLNRSLGGDVS